MSREEEIARGDHDDDRVKEIRGFKYLNHTALRTSKLIPKTFFQP